MNYYPPNRGEDESRGNKDAAGEYRARNERTSFSDAGYIPLSEAPTISRRYREIPEKKIRKRISPAGIIALCLVCVLLGTTIGLGFAWSDFLSSVKIGGLGGSAEPGYSQGSNDGVGNKPLAPAVTTKPQLTVSATEGSSMAASDIYTMACSQVVGITTEITYNNIFGMPTSGAVTGSGFILSEDGYILTNYHVIEYAVRGNYKISVMLYNGDSYEAKVVGYENEDSDIAVLKIEATGLNPASLGNSDTMHVGDTVYAVGNPLGELAYTMTRGMVSALDRDITSQDEQTGVTNTINMFQFDAAVNSGNSGGPVYNEFGEVIGVVTAKYSRAGVEGLGFGIPINDAISIANDLIQYGYVSGKAYMGISVQTVSSAVAEYYNMVQGAYVYAVDSNGCAARAGIQMGDIITALGDTKIMSSSDLVSAKKAYKAGDTVKITVYRNGKYLTFDLTFDEDKSSAR